MKLKYNYYSRAIIDILLKEGVAGKDVYSVLDIPSEVENPLDFELTIDGIHYLTLLYRDRMKVQHCGLEISRFINIQDTGFFGSYAFSCPTLGEAVSRIYSIHKEINPFITYEMAPVQNPSGFIYHIDELWEIKYPESALEITDFAIANGLLSARKLTRQDIIPLQIEFKYNKPDDISLYQEIFKCPLYFGKKVNRIQYSLSIMDYKIPTYNPFLLNILKDFAQKTIRENASEKDIVTEVKSIIVKAEEFKIPREDEIAARLGISRRTLQKKLHEQDTSFQEIRELVLKELAITYLKSNTISNKEIAWILGYNDISNYYRAFKRWTGGTPNDYRLRNKNG